MKDSGNSIQKSTGPKVKVLMLGDTCVGKSSILSRLVEDKFSPNFMSTLGVEYKQKNMEVNGQVIQLQIWDTAGQERFKTVTPIYYKSVDGVVMVYDINDRSTFKNVEYWLGNLYDHADPKKISLLLAGNKLDIQQNRAVDKEEAQKKAEQLNMKFFECSAKTNQNITQMFQQLTAQIMEKKKQQAKEVDSDGVVIKSPQKTESTQRREGCCS